MIKIIPKKWFVNIGEGESWEESIVALRKCSIQFRYETEGNRMKRVETRYAYMLGIDLFFAIIKIRWTKWQNKQSQ